LVIFWETKRGPRLIPSRADFAVGELRPWIGNLALLDIQSDGKATFRICGTNLLGRFGGEQTRKSLDDLRPDIRTPFQHLIQRICHTPKPTHETLTLRIDEEDANFQELALPLSDDGANVHAVLFASYPVSKK
jgi:hypothetical protein